MRTVVRSIRFYFWPIIVANCVAMTFAIGADVLNGIRLSLALSFLASFGFLVNDLADRAIDLVNKANHFELSSGRTIALGKAAGATFFVLAGVCVFPLGSTALLVAGAIAVILTSYSFVLRRWLVVPTVATAVVASSPCWAPLALWTPEYLSTSRWWLLVLALFLMIAARETVMDVRDRRGDAAGNRRTVPLVFGDGTAMKVSAAMALAGSIVLFAASFGARQQGQINRLILVALAATVTTLVLHPLLQTLRFDHDRQRIQEFVLRSRIGMAIVPVLTILL